MSCTGSTAIPRGAPVAWLQLCVSSLTDKGRTAAQQRHCQCPVARTVLRTCIPPVHAGVLPQDGAQLGEAADGIVGREVQRLRVRRWHLELIYHGLRPPARSKMQVMLAGVASTSSSC
jgi:hypothetical protein